MYISETTVRVRYSETDQLGIVYYGNYAQYYEVGRVEALRQINSSYKDLEDSGVSMPVLNLHCEFIRPALYDDLLTVRTIIKEMPSTRMKFEYEIFNEKGELLNRGSSELAFLSLSTRRPIRAPQWFLDVLEKAHEGD